MITKRILTRDKRYYHDLFFLALPIALQNLITFLVTFADNLMVNTLGDSAVSGVFVGSQIQTFLQTFTFGSGTAISILGSMYLGKDDRASFRKLVGIGTRFNAYFGLAATAVCLILPRAVVSIFTPEASVIREGVIYLRYVCASYAFFCIAQYFMASARCIGAPKIGTYISAISLVTNIVLNYILIFGKLGLAPMGVKGAAIATLVSRILEAVLAGGYLLVIDRTLSLKLRDFLTGGGQLRKDYYRCGAPLVAGEIVWSINLLAANAILGRYGEAVLAAASIVSTMTTLAYIIMAGMNSANGLITSRTVGSGDTERMKEYARTAQVIFLTLGLIMCAILLLIRGFFVSLYTGISQEAANYALQFILVLAVSIIGTYYEAPCLFMVKSGGEINFVFRNDSIFVFLVVLPSAYISMRLGAAPWIVYACLKCDQVLKSFVAFVKVNRFNWMKNLARDT